MRKPANSAGIVISLVISLSMLMIVFLVIQLPGLHSCALCLCSFVTCICMHVSACMSVCVCVSVCLSAYVFICMHILMHEWMCLYVYVCIVCVSVCMRICVSACVIVLYRLPYFSHVPMSDYFTFQTTDISIRYRLLQTYNNLTKID